MMLNYTDIICKLGYSCKEIFFTPRLVSADRKINFNFLQNDLALIFSEIYKNTDRHFYFLI